MTLMQRVQADKGSSKGLVSTSRHTHFGGVLKLTLPKGEQSESRSGKKAVAKSSFASDAFRASSGTLGCVPKAQAKRDKRKLVFNASAQGLHRTRQVGLGSTSAAVSAAPTSHYKVLAQFCSKFFEQAYNPFFSNVKREFRLESSRLAHDESDRIMFFDLIRFFLALRKESRPHAPPAAAPLAAAPAATALAATAATGDGDDDDADEYTPVVTDESSAAAARRRSSEARR